MVYRVAVGVSSGVDSTVAALLLSKMRKQFEVIGIFMKNWDLTDETGHCQADKDAEEAESICKRIGIPFKNVNLVKEYWNEVFEPLVTGYEAGVTPNPDILCNRNVKFNHFHRHCVEQVGCDLVATGHYAMTSRFDADLSERRDFHLPVRLLKSADLVKDQTFFLSQVSHAALMRSLFPVGGLVKSQVKKIAREEGFSDIAAKKESMGICFIGKRRAGFQGFIREYLEPRAGDIVDIDSGRVVGQHQGVHLWTLGQRLRLSGMKDKLYVAHKDVTDRVLYACRGAHHPALYTDLFEVDVPHWISRSPDDGEFSPDRGFRCQFRFQNTHALTNCRVIRVSHGPSGRLRVHCVEPLRAVTPGQFAAFYCENECLGSAVITRTEQDLLSSNGTAPTQNYS